MKRRVSITTASLLASLAAAPLASAELPTRQIVAMLDGTQNFGTTQRAVNFYDVTDLTGGTVFGQQPLFSAWVGYEDSLDVNYEEVSSLAINPVNGMAYLLAYDSGDVGTTANGVSDTNGDFDLYRLDYQAMLNDFVSNNRPKGTMYAGTSHPDTNPQAPSHPNATNMVNLANAVSKVGEVARAQSSGFFDVDLDFIDPGHLVLMDNETDGDDIAENDHQIRVLTRVSTDAGQATYDAETNEGGFNGGSLNATSESWESNVAGLFNMDSQGRSEVEDIVAVRRDGVVGFWAGESDGGGDGIAFFELDFSGEKPVAIKRELAAGESPFATGFSLDEDPVTDASTNDGDHDAIMVDGQGNIVISESGYFDDPSAEPKTIGRTITDYAGVDSDGNGNAEMGVGGWTVSPNMPQPISDDDPDAVTDGRFVTYDKANNLVYVFDLDNSSQGSDVVADAYVFDPATGAFVYEEQNAVNHYMLSHGIRWFNRGDVNNDGLVTAADIDMLFDVDSDATLEGVMAEALGNEWYDLTSDMNVDGDDLDELIGSILGTHYGDADLDGDVDLDDLTILGTFYGEAGGWAEADFNGDKIVDLDDLTILGTFYGSGVAQADLVSFDAALAESGLNVLVPEPSSLLFLGFTALGLSRKRRQA